MTTVTKRSSTKAICFLVSLVMIMSALVVSVAIFTDRVNRTTTVQAARFDDNGYTVERTAPSEYLVEGETVDIQLEENNTKDDNLRSQISITGVWHSPVAEKYPWGNKSSLENVAITYETTNKSDEIDYTVNADNTISFVLPSNQIASGDVLKSALRIALPSNLAATGSIELQFTSIELSKGAWSTLYDNEKLSNLRVEFGVAWNITKANSESMEKINKDVIAVLTESKRSIDNGYGLHVIKNGKDLNTNGGRIMDWSAPGDPQWANYNITDLSIDEKITTIGDYAFAGETGITDMIIPNTVEQIGTSAFDGSGLTGEIVIPASVYFIENLAFGNLPMVNTISFEHTENTLTLPNNNTTDNLNEGAFYVDQYTKTTINTSVQEIISGYNWINDNRKTVPTLAEKDTWFTQQDGTKLDKNSITSIIFADTYSPNASRVIKSWDASDGKVDTVTAYVEDDGSGNGTYKLTIAGNGHGVIYANENSHKAFYNLQNITSMTATNLLDTQNATDMSYMFNSNAKLTNLDIKSWNTSNVTDMTGMFQGCIALTELDLSTNTTSYMRGSGTYTAWNTEKLESTDLMFDMRTEEPDGATEEIGGALTSINFTGWNATALESAEGMFADCFNLTNIPGTEDWTVTNLKEASAMFYRLWSLENIDVSSWMPDSLETSKQMFYHCDNLKSINIADWNMTNTTDTSDMFAYCKSLTELTIPAELTNIGDRFAYQCTKLTTINFEQATGTTIEFPADGKETGAFYVDTPYLGTKVKANNNTATNYGWITDNRGYTITVVPSSSGTVKSNFDAAINGKTITLTAIPNQGIVYNGSTIKYTDEAGTVQTVNLNATTLTFTMPAADVTISPIMKKAKGDTVAYLDGVATGWWLRSPDTSTTNYVWSMSGGKAYSRGGSISDNQASRPAMIFSSSAIFDPETNELIGTGEGKSAGDYAVGDIVFLPENGEMTAYIVVHQGNPDKSIYDASCNGTWLLRDNAFKKTHWYRSGNPYTDILNDYDESWVHEDLNKTFLSRFDSNVQGFIQDATIPYVYHPSIPAISTLTTKIFLLSGPEVGVYEYDMNMAKKEGARLSFFSK